MLFVKKPNNTQFLSTGVCVRACVWTGKAGGAEV